MALEAESSPEPLTRTLIELLTACIAVGTDDSKSLAAYLGVSPATVDSSFKRIHQRLGTNTRGAALLFALNRGWIVLPKQQPPID